MFSFPSHSIRQLEKRNVANEIEIMLWCDRMDLVALANVKGIICEFVYKSVCVEIVLGF